jgi:hypothetical protein
MDEWTVLLRDHHPGYITWEQFEKNQARLQQNAFRKAAGDAKSGRGGRALLTGLLRCRRCGRMLQVTYSGHYSLARYSCKLGNAVHGLEPCINFGATRPDAVVARVLLDVVQPFAVEAAIMAEEQASLRERERRQALELERQQAEYEVRRAQRRYESVDDDNRLVAAELETRWNAALAHLRDCEARIATSQATPSASPDGATLLTLAEDLETAWNSATTAMRTKQQLVRTLVQEIVVDVDHESREVVLVIHWRGGHHSELRVRKPRSGEHTKSASVEADQLIRDMAMRWSDEHVAATLNRMGLETGQGMTWTARRVESHRRNHDIVGYESAIKDGTCLTMSEAAAKLGVSHYAIRRLIKTGALPARQVVEDAPWQIMTTDLERPEVQASLRNAASARVAIVIAGPAVNRESGEDGQVGLV